MNSIRFQERYIRKATCGLEHIHTPQESLKSFFRKGAIYICDFVGFYSRKMEIIVWRWTSLRYNIDSS